MSVPPVQLIVIGGSAGGIEALRAILPAIPRHAPPVVVALHYPPFRGGELVSLFGGMCICPVREAMDKEPLATGTITFAPPGYHAMVESDFTVSLSVDGLVNYSRPSIDVLFESAAFSAGKQTLGIVLSGANEDGAKGLASIRGSVGLAWVQDPAEVPFRIMPDAAIRAANPQLIAGAAEIAAKFRDWPASLRS